MEMNSQEVHTPPRPAATLVMLRDSAPGMEVFMLQRHGLSDVLGGAYVFPGGKVDRADAELDLERHIDQPHGGLAGGLNEPELDDRTAASLYIAVLREAFEESGVLFVVGATAAVSAQAHELLRQGHQFEEVLALMALRLQTRDLVPWARWITPRVPTVTNKRFDTRFFIAPAPPGQEGGHDNHEAVHSVWLTPRAALTRYWAGEMELAPPQIMSLAHLAHFSSVREALAAARQRLPPVIAPEPFDHQGTRVVCYPGDERHPVAQRALPGPTRLVWRNRRFEPQEGFEALFEPLPVSPGRP